MQGTGFIKKEERKFGTEISFLILDLIFNGVLAGICAVSYFIINTESVKFKVTMYLIPLIVLVGILAFFDILMLVVNFITMANSKSVYYAISNNELIIHHSNQAKCATIPLEKIREVKKRKVSGGGIIGRFISGMSGAGYVTVKYLAPNNKELSLDFGAINNCRDFCDVLRSLAQRKRATAQQTISQDWEKKNKKPLAFKNA